MKQLITQLNAYLCPSQVKSKKTFRNQNKPSPPIELPALKKLRRLEASARASFYTNMLHSRKGVLHTLLNLNLKYKEVIPSQAWLADELDYTVRTINTAARELDELGIIDKKSRGWNVVDVKSNTYKSKTCSYLYGEKFVKDMEFISKNDTSSSRNLAKLFKAIPAIHSYFKTFFLLTLLFLNNSYSRSNNNYNTKKSVTFFGQDNHEIAEIYKNKEILPTTSVPTHASILSVLEETHPANIYQIQEDSDYPYTPENRGEMLKDKLKYLDKKEHQECKAEEPKKGKTEAILADKRIDLRYCSEVVYKFIKYKYKEIIHHYHEARMSGKYSCIDEYEKHLVYNGRTDLIYNPSNVLTDLTDEEISIIKSFPEGTIEYVKIRLKAVPRNKNSFKWICDTMIAKCEKDNIDIKDLLEKHGFNNKHIIPDDSWAKAKEQNPQIIEERRLKKERQKTDELSRRYPCTHRPYASRKQQTNISSTETPEREEDPSSVKFKSDSTLQQEFIDLVGEEAYLAYVERTGLFDKDNGKQQE